MKKQEKSQISHPILLNNSKLINSENKVLEFINGFQGEVFNYSIEDLAKLANVSTATVFRFVRKYGFKNFKEAIIFINKNLQKLNEKYPLSTSQDNNISTIVAGNKYVLDNLYTNELQKIIEKAAQIIYNSKRILIHGAGSSKRMAETLVSNLYKVSLNVIAHDDFHLFLPVLGNATTEDVYVLFSDNLNSPEAVFTIKQCREKKVQIILITSKKKSNLITKNDVVILYEKITSKHLNIPLSSKWSQLLIADLLFENLLILDSNLREKLNNSIQIINKWKANL
ncbi:MurR/RpiR family transcriptional regulator [Mycoplasmopsis synoviae]|uniref:MurR/RpiR family transcriptional regulator n=1 Tax=Mycoplasmopsis synoviae TaxID=2109 RepID=A0AAX3F0S5_MYCSY|nr:MurR/RpiR family transcriptional regulator [Mycoplasmopsis synoviae]QGL45277.1 MurR/RpiR family transcriptional regulator [Mycoplasmopsis synoviae]ULL02459.1 MurR/RpiR family transcriptional regulator [Mycoplasmopsis synoviae]UZW64502.1 MurR/RpiR family transcriptional regulator [Mycoplasmopsis synoviae]